MATATHKYTGACIVRHRSSEYPTRRKMSSEFSVGRNLSKAMANGIDAAPAETAPNSPARALVRKSGAGRPPVPVASADARLSESNTPSNIPKKTNPWG